MPTIVLNEKEILEFKNKFNDILKEPTNEYMLYFFQYNGGSVSIYKSGKTVFQGSDLSRFSEYLNNVEINDNTTYDYDKYDSIGADEVGTGDTFGPIVCASCFVSKDKVSILKEMGVTDSKKINDEKIKELGKYLISNYKYKVSVVRNENYNDHFDKYNMNEMKAKLHNYNISMLAKEVNYEKIILDEFVNKEKYFEYLDDNAFKNICFEMKGESKSTAVAAASIIARFYFLIEFDKLIKTYGYELKKGSSVEVSELINKIKKDGKEDILYHICKLNFKNVK